MKLIFKLFFLSIFLIPFYFFNSGLPQLSHFLFFLSFLLLLIVDNKPVSIYKIFDGFKFFSVLVLLILTIGVVYFSIYKDLKSVFSPIYYIFNYLAMYTSIRLYLIDKDRFIKYSFNVLFFSTFVLLIVALFNLEGFFHRGLTFYRKILTFNNPNQLGYWTLLSATILFILKPKIKHNVLNSLKIYFILIALIYLSLLSLSKAATISIAILILLNSIKNMKITVLIVLVSFLFYNTLINQNDDNFLKRFDKRVNDIGDASDDNLEGRGYYRIKDYPEYIFIGAGEGATERFQTEIEMHSSFGTLLFSYGFLGLLLFLIFLFKIFLLSKFKFIQQLIPLLLYGISHMGLRFTLFWLSLSFFILLNNKSLNSFLENR